ncbi:beta-(1,2)-xylosyltransferase-like [Stylophora pistillata]|uniref:beta-(1,2)-xylosyltransferase-like n=1 Tax=Stylophora pistillata TaxID=50429 RepID=UPI000C03AE68|nr:beta-(1,2)-xylosyltransferase-like [Stylophora pistillata]
MVLRYIIIRPKFGHARVLEAHVEFPNEEDEFFVLDKGFFTLYCRGNMVKLERQLLFADRDNTLMRWKAAMEVANPSQYLSIGGQQSFQDGHYFAIQRIEFANVYWTIIDLLDIFITTQSVSIQPEKLNIILIDAHPKSSLDSFWTVLFQRLIKLNDKDFFKNSNTVVFENLIWRYPRKKSPLLDINLKSSRHIQPFRSFVLKEFGISAAKHLRNCSQQNLNVLVILRRDYESHPRNLAAVIDRKIANEEEVLQEIKTSFPNGNITAAQLDLWPLKAQLETIANTDILFGMHGAAHAFSIFMEPGGVVVEMFNDYSQARNWHMGKIATLSDHSHISWTNSNPKAVNKDTKSTIIPKGLPSSLLKKAVASICSKRSKVLS